MARLAYNGTASFAVLLSLPVALRGALVEGKRCADPALLMTA
ncbi:hypothetical protein [Polymorphobacter sp. PAMC 29334]|nr:hypothetical protein [Polymorphobacter sp. PAMC 29334]